MERRGHLHACELSVACMLCPLSRCHCLWCAVWQTRAAICHALTATGIWRSDAERQLLTGVATNDLLACGVLALVKLSGPHHRLPLVCAGSDAEPSPHRLREPVLRPCATNRNVALVLQDARGQLAHGPEGLQQHRASLVSSSCLLFALNRLLLEFRRLRRFSARM
jgi:hypothetical protein